MTSSIQMRMVRTESGGFGNAAVFDFTGAKEGTGVGDAGVIRKCQKCGRMGAQKRRGQMVHCVHLAHSVPRVGKDDDLKIVEQCKWKEPTPAPSVGFPWCRK